MGAAHSSKEKLTRTYSERYIHSQSIERERFGSFGKRGKGKMMSVMLRGHITPRTIIDFTVNYKIIVFASDFQSCLRRQIVKPSKKVFSIVSGNLFFFR